MLRGHFTILFLYMFGISQERRRGEEERGMEQLAMQGSSRGDWQREWGRALHLARWCKKTHEMGDSLPTYSWAPPQSQCGSDSVNIKCLPSELLLQNEN